MGWLVRVKNWGKFQHYKNRRPPWIKFHVETLDDRAIMSLSPTDYRVLTLSWLVYSKKENFPNFSDWAFQLRISEKQLKESLQRLKGFIEVDASDTLAGGQQLAPESSPESEAESEAESETENTSSGKPDFMEYEEIIQALKPDDLIDQNLAFQIAWKHYPERVGKKAAKRHFVATVKTKKDWLRNVHGFNFYIDWVQHHRRNGQKDLKFQGGSRWFNEWDDWAVRAETETERVPKL